MSIFSIAICDDEPVSCSKLVDIVAKHQKSKNFLIKVFHSGEDMWDYIQKEHAFFDLIILDICLYELDGVEVGKLLRKSALGQQPNILYVSGDSSYAMQLFEVGPIDFLIKPVCEEALLHNIDIAIEQSQPPRQTFSYVNKKIIFSVRYTDILYFELMSKIVIIHTVDGSNPRFYGKMEDIRKQVGYQQNFLQTHGSFLVNWEHVCKVFPDDIVLSNDEVIRVTRLFKKSVKDFAKMKMGKR